MKLKISLCQFDICHADPQNNLTRVSNWVAEASRVESQLLVLPELWDSGYDLSHWDRYATPIDQGVYPQVAALAAKFNLWIAGSTLELLDGRPYNTLTVFDPQGGLKACYRKIHLFRLMEEDRWLTPGSQLQTVDTPWARLGLAICYDLRFPEIFRQYALAGAELVLLPSQWPEIRINHWDTLVRARAIENQFFIAAVNRMGSSQQAAFGGHSAVVGPWGEVCVEGGNTETLLTTEIDFDEVTRARQRIPVFQDRRPDIYG
jgi:predicted amidohydrolase